MIFSLYREQAIFLLKIGFYTNQIKYARLKFGNNIEKHNTENKVDPSDCPSDCLTLSILILYIQFTLFFVCDLFFFFLNYDFQERNRAFSTPSEAWLLCKASHEGHPHWPAYDLHTPPYVHCDLHEEVTKESVPSASGSCQVLPHNHEPSNFHPC